MNRVLRSAIALAVLLSSPSVRAEEGEPVVRAIQVEGNRRVEVDAVKAAVGTKVGQPLEAKRIQADVRAIMRLGFFSDVVVEERAQQDGVAVVFKVTERPSVQSTRIEGNDELAADDFKEAIDIKPFSVLDVGAVKKSVRKIQEKYVDKGFYLADVSYRLEDRPDNQVVVVFVVNENAKVQVKQVRFLGNTHMPKEDLFPYMQTQEGGYLAFLSSGGTYKEDAFQHDLQAIQAVYLEHGYVNAKVGKPSIQLSPDKRFLYITIQVEEGEQYRIGKVDFTGELLDHRPELEFLLQSRTGDIFQRSRVAHDLFAVGDVYRDLGYAYANVTPMTNLDPKERTLGLVFDVQPGQKVTFERIEISGNSKTRDKVIRRELRIYEGELYGATLIKISKQRVTALGYFETVEITTKKGSADDKIVATVEVKEKSTGTFQIGAGFSSYESFILTGQISQNNFFGWGQTLSLQVQWSAIRQLGQIQFVEPYFFDTKWTFAFDLYATDSFYSNFSRKAIGGSLTWGYELSGLAWLWPWARHLEDIRIFGTYTNEYVKVTSAVQDLLLYNRFRSGTTSAIRLSLQWDKRDNRLFPTAGLFLSLSAEYAPPLLAPSWLFGEAVNLFSRYTVDLRWYKPIAGGLVFRSRFLAGAIFAWDQAHPVPISELYYIGGINTVRGYRLFDIAPRTLVGVAPSPDAALRTLAIGGNKELVLNFELEYPLLEKLGIRGVVFFDMGNAFAPGAWTDPNVSWSLYKSWGFGFRWLSPIGPLRFEWGIPLNRRRDPVTGAWLDQPLDFQFTIGNFF